MAEVSDRFIAQATGHEIVMPDKEGKHPQIVVTLTAVEGPRSGRSVQKYLSLHPNAAEISAKQLRAMGWRCNDITKLEGLGEVKCQVTEQMREYPPGSGKMRPDYAIWPLTTRNTLRDEDAKKFADRFKALAIQTKDNVIAVTDDNRALVELPQPQGMNGQSDVGSPGGADF